MKVKLHVLIRRIKRSFRNDREQWIKGGILAAILLVIVIFAGSCACGKKKVKEPDAASQGVMKITPAGRTHLPRIPVRIQWKILQRTNKKMTRFFYKNADSFSGGKSGWEKRRTVWNCIFISRFA